MSTERVSPIVARNFQVRFVLLGPRGGRAEQRELAFSQVVFPPFRLDGRVVRGVSDGGVGDGEPGSSPNLVLRRGHTGSPVLYEWWRAERDDERTRVREVIVVLLDEDHRPVTAWHFTGCHIVSLDYSPLDAVDLGVLMESLELSFKRVEQIHLDT
jgi:hypothetical protein